MKIQEFAIKMINLVHRARLEDQATKVLMFRGLYLKDQDRIMLINSIKTEEELKKKSVKDYLKRIMRLLKRKEIKRKRKESNLDRESTENIKSTWN